MHDETPAQPSLVFTDVHAGYVPDQHILTACSFSIRGPGIVRLSGPNGSGKSTIVELASGFLVPTSGTVTVAGVDAHSDSARSLRSVCRTTPALFPSMTASDHLHFAARCAHVDAAPLVERAELLGLGPWLDLAAGELSTGNARKLWILCCVARVGPVIVLDEPFNGLDHVSSDALAALLSEWAATRLIVCIAHDPPASLHIASTVELKPSL